MRVGGETGHGAEGGRDEWANAMARLKKVRGMTNKKNSTNQFTDRASDVGWVGGGGGGRGPGGKTAILAVNKIDAAGDRDVKGVVPLRVAASFAAVVYVSARRGDGLQELERSLAAVVEGGDVAAEGAAWTANQRQAEAMQTALGALRRLRGGDRPTDQSATTRPPHSPLASSHLRFFLVVFYPFSQIVLSITEDTHVYYLSQIP